jgi:hypothetical protein
MPTPWPPRCARPQEEVGLARRHVEVIGRLPVYTTVTGFVVTPVVGLVQPPFDLRIDTGEVAEAFEVPLQFLMTPAHHRRHRWDAAAASPGSSCRCRGRRNAPDELLHLGRHRGHAAQPVRLPGGTHDGLGCWVSSTTMSFFAVLLALVIEQLKPLPRDNWVHHLLVSWVRWTGRNFDAGRAAPCLGGVGRVGAGAWRAAGRGVPHHRPLEPAAGAAVRRGRAVPDAGLPPVQPLLHRHPRRAGPRRRGRGPPPAGRMAPPGRQRTAAHRAAAPCDRACLAGRAPACVRRVLLVRAVLHPGPGAAGCGALPHGRVRRPVLDLSQQGAGRADANQG